MCNPLSNSGGCMFYIIAWFVSLGIQLGAKMKKLILLISVLTFFGCEEIMSELIPSVMEPDEDCNTGMGGLFGDDCTDE